MLSVKANSDSMRGYAQTDIFFQDNINLRPQFPHQRNECKGYNEKGNLKF